MSRDEINKSDKVKFESEMLTHTFSLSINLYISSIDCECCYCLAYFFSWLDICSVYSFCCCGMRDNSATTRIKSRDKETPAKSYICEECWCCC